MLEVRQDSGLPLVKNLLLHTKITASTLNSSFDFREEDPLIENDEEEHNATIKSL
jgi:hypothetical protein